MRRTTEEMENAPRPRGESAKIDLKEKLPELPEGYNLDGTPKAHSPTPASREIADGKAGWTAFPLDADSNGKKRDAGTGHPHPSPDAPVPPSPDQGKASGERNDPPPEAGKKAEPEKPETGAGAKDESQEEKIPFKGLAPLGALKAELENVAQRRTERAVWVKGKWVQMEIRSGKCSFALIKEPMIQEGEILDALNAIKELGEEICEASDELAEEAKRTIRGEE